MTVPPADGTEPVRIRQTIATAHDMATKLRELTRAAADQPTEDAWWKLRQKAYGVDKWRRKLEEQVHNFPEYPRVRSAYLEVSAAVTQAFEVIRDLKPLFERAGFGGSTRDRQAARTGVFSARFPGTCTACGRPIRVGQAARYAEPGGPAQKSTKIVHDDCAAAVDSHV